MKKLSSWVVPAIMVLAMCGVVLAQAAPAAATPAAEPIWKRILFGAIGGVIAALIGWAKNRDDKTNTQEKFSLKYAAITVAIGAVVGAIAGALGKTLPEFFSQYESLPIWGFAMMGAEALLKALGRQSIGVAKFLGIVKAGAVNPPAPEPPKP
jgi:uncharacterized membrane protein YfcA